MMHIDDYSSQQKVSRRWVEKLISNHLLPSVKINVLYELSNGDITQFEKVKKMKVSEASIVMMIKEINAFKQWWAGEATRE